MSKRTGNVNTIQTVTEEEFEVRSEMINFDGARGLACDTRSKSWGNGSAAASAATEITATRRMPTFDMIVSEYNENFDNYFV